MKATRKLIPAIAMLLVSLAVMSTASFAWFTMSRQVTAQGMNVSVTAPNNLMIKQINVVGGEYGEIATYSAENVILVPASSNSGLDGDIYVVDAAQPVNPTTGALIDGQTKLAAATPAVGNADPASATEGGYYDFKYNVKTDNTSADVVVVVTGITIKNAAGSANAEAGKVDGRSIKPVRIAIITTAGSKVFNAGAGTNMNDGKVVDSIAADTKLPTLGTVSYTDLATKKTDTGLAVFTVPKAELEAGGSIKDGTGNIDITIRVWFEGQDSECTAAAAANAAFSLEVVLADVTSLAD